MQKLLLPVALLAISLSANAQDGSFHLDKEYAIATNGIVDLSSSDADVIITGTKRKNAHVKIDRKVEVKGWSWGDKDFKVEVETVGNDLRIRERQTNGSVSIVGSYREEYKIQIEVPESVGLKVRGDDGDYYVKNINGEISISADDGDIELVNCKGNRFYIRLDDGDLKMQDGAGSLDIVADDADVVIYNGTFTSIHADVDDGDLRIETSLADSGDYELESEDGHIELSITSGGGEFDIRHDDGRVITEGSFEKLEKTESRTHLTLKGGNAKVNFRMDDASVRLIARK